MLPSTGLGIDIVDIADFNKTLDRSGEAFIQSVFTKDEIAYCQGRSSQHFAVRWAAKEAFFKASWDNDSHDIDPLDVEIVSEVGRAPKICLSGRAACWARLNGVKVVDVSLSHSRCTAIAVVMINCHIDKMNLNMKGENNMVATTAGPLHVLESSFPQTKKAFEQLVTVIEEENTLDERTRELILVGMLAAMRAPLGVQFHARKAIELGASNEDVISAVTLALPVAGIATTADGLRAVTEIVR